SFRFEDIQHASNLNELTIKPPINCSRPPTSGSTFHGKQDRIDQPNRPWPIPIRIGRFGSAESAGIRPSQPESADSAFRGAFTCRGSRLLPLEAKTNESTFTDTIVSRNRSRALMNLISLRSISLVKSSQQSVKLETEATRSSQEWRG